MFKTGLLLSSLSLTVCQIHCQGRSQPIIAKADSLFAVRDWSSASHLYESALTDTTNNSLAWNRFGFANYNLGKYDDALRNYEKSLSQHPAPFLRSLVFSRIAKVQAIKNNRQAALLALDSAISLGYNNVGEMDTLADFNSLRNETYFKHLREQVYFNRNPCMADAHAREFDFWVGEWDVYQTGTRNYAGHSLVQLISGGCVCWKIGIARQAPARA
jgi:tetratricopeptide (TPR) repeat protein